METYYWNDQINYLKKSVGLYYNDDYLQFLVDKVWQIDKPIKVIDFGCGFGHLGLRLLPLLPEGSTYTGIDLGDKLIEYAHDLFNGSPYQTEFFVGDINTFTFERKFDVAVCHAVLLHMSDPINVLKSMIGCVKENGKVIAFEPHWNGNHAGYYFEGIELSDVIPLGQLQELFERDVKSTGKDGNIGLKLPIYFNRLGLRNVQCRVSDKVNVLDSTVDSELAPEQYKAMQFNDPGDRDSFINALVGRGMLVSEATRQYEAEKLLSKIFTTSQAVSYAPGMKITFGTVA